MLFWIVSTLLAIAVAGLLALALLRARGQGEPPAAYDLRVYRDQLREVDRDLARGVIDPADADRIRTEVSRRTLAADAQLQEQTGGGRQRGPGVVLLAAGLAVALVLGGALLYRGLGAPGYADLPRQLRLRGLGGQVVVDPAPMPKKDRRQVESALKAALKKDAVETIVVGWTNLGLLELQRKRDRVPVGGLL